MKKPFKVLSAAAMAAVVVVPSIVVPVQAAAATPAAATTPDQLVFTNDAGQQFLVSYEDYADFLFGEGNFVGVLEGKAPSAIGIDGKYVDYKKFQDILFEEGNAGLPTSDLLDKAVKDESNLVDKETSDSYVDVTFDKDGKPVYGEPEPTEVEVALEKATTAVTALPNVDDVKATDEAAVTAAAKLVADAKALGADVTALEAKVTALQAKIAEMTAVVSVESVMAITETGVEVTVAASEEDRTETIKVTDPEGNEVEVKSTLIPAGQTKVTFDFATAYDKLPLGTFKVAGKDFDTAAVAAVKDVKEAAAANGGAGNVIKLWSALQSTYFEGALEENIDAYKVAIDKAVTDNKLSTVEDVNKLISDVNKAQVSDEAEAAVVKSVVDGINGNALQVYNLLNKNFDRVNSDWVAEYLLEAVEIADGTTNTVLGSLDEDNYFGVADTGVTVEAIQDAIDTANAKQVAAAYDVAFKSLKSSDVADARALANKYLTANADDAVTQKEYANDSLDILDALIRVNEAKTPNALKSALTTLDNLDTALVNKYNAVDPDSNLEKDIDLTKVNDELLQKYIDAIALVVAPTGKNQRSDIQSIITGVNNSTSVGLVDAVDTAVTNNNADELLAALKALKLDNVADSNKAKYLTDKSDFATAADSADVAKSITDLQTQVNKSNVAAIGAAATADTRLTAIKVAGLKNVVDANKQAYLTGVQFTKNMSPVDYFVLATTKEEAQLVVDTANAYASANKATTATEMRSALTTFAVALNKIGGVNEAPLFINLSNQAKLEVASIVLDDKTANFANAKALGDAVVAAMAAHEATLTSINGNGNDIAGIDADSTIVEVDAALSSLGYEAYDNLGDVERLAVAQAFLDALPVDDKGDAVALTYKTIAEITADIDKAIAKPAVQSAE